MIFWQGSKTKSVSVLKYNVTSQSGVVSNEVKQVIKDGVSVWAKYVGEVHVEIGEHVKWYEIIRDSSNEPDAEDIYITGDSSGEEEFSVYYGDKFHIAAQADSGYLFEDTGSEYCDDEWTVGDTPPDLTVFTYKPKQMLPKPSVATEVDSNGLLYVTVTNTSNIYVYAKLYDIQRYFIGSQFVKYDESWMSGYYADPEALDDPGDYTGEYRSPGSIPAGQSVRLGPFGQGQWYISCWNGFATLMPTESYTDRYYEGSRQEFRGNNNGYIDWD